MRRSIGLGVFGQLLEESGVMMSEDSNSAGEGAKAEAGRPRSEKSVEAVKKERSKDSMTCSTGLPEIGMELVEWLWWWPIVFAKSAMCWQNLLQRLLKRIDHVGAFQD